MPLYKVISTPHAKIYIWHITETEEYLRSSIVLQPKHQKRLDNMFSTQHRKGFLSVRKLLAIAGYSDFSLYYNNNGKPLLRDKNHISITHSYQYAAIAISSKKIGIDIEKLRDKITKIANKFCNKEREYLPKQQSLLINCLTVIWGVKESLYKICDTKGLSFKNNMYVAPFFLESFEGIAQVTFANNTTEFFNFYFEEFDGFTLVFSLKENDVR